MSKAVIGLPCVLQADGYQGSGGNTDVVTPSCAPMLHRNSTVVCFDVKSKFFSDTYGKILSALTYDCGTFLWWMWMIKTFIYIYIWWRLRIGDATMRKKSYLAGVKDAPPHAILSSNSSSAIYHQFCLPISFFHISFGTLSHCQIISPSKFENLIYTCKFTHHYTSWLFTLLVLHLYHI